jgi:hypothetical protein
LVNSRLGSFAAAFKSSPRKGDHPRRHSLSRSYGVVLPSSLTGVLSRALGFSPRLPVSVCGTGTGKLARGFSWQCEIGPFGTKLPSPSRLGHTCDGFAYRTPYPAWTGTSITRRYLPSCVPPSLMAVTRWYGNLNPLSIAYAFRPRLRSRLTLSGRTLLRKP